jgi:hypothetical protein
MTKYITATSTLPPYMIYPRFLLDSKLNETAKLLYVVLLDRARLSQVNEGWTDDRGHVYLYYPVKSLADAIHKSEMTIKTALSTLENADLIVRRRQGIGLPNRIYVKYPADSILSDRQTENCLADGQKSISDTDKKLSTNKNKRIKTIEQDTGSNGNRTAYGNYQNVFLSDKELLELQQDIPSYQDYIERLSNYMASTGKSYQNHAATIRSWALRDNPAPLNRTYDCREDECL